jgi:hypothetical protein
MDNIAEVIDLGKEDIPLKSTNFGSGIELLMNDKVKEKSSSDNDIAVDDLKSLEAELNEFIPNGEGEKINISLGDNIEILPEEPPIKVNFSEPKLGTESLNDMNNEQTWDGFAKFNDIPVNPETTATSATPAMTKEELLREKFKYLKRLEGLQRKGAELTKQYNMDSSLQEMMGEYEMLIQEKEKENSIKFQGNMLSAAINGIEFLNNRFDPFDVKLDGWGEQFSENISDYDEIFAELHEKYKSKAKMAPEIKLLFQLAGSAMMVHMSNTLFKSSLPNMDDIMRQNPELAQQFTQAAVNTMGQTNPGVSGFMNNVMNAEPKPVNTGPPPPPVKTQNMVPPKRPGFREGNSFARPDLTESKTEIGDNYANVNSNDKIIQPQSAPRQEMKGPSNVDHLLAGLKTKSINIQEEKKEDEGSTISISELKELQKEGVAPRKTKRRQKSDKNVVSLDI